MAWNKNSLFVTETISTYNGCICWIEIHPQSSRLWKMEVSWNGKKMPPNRPFQERSFHENHPFFWIPPWWKQRHLWFWLLQRWVRHRHHHGEKFAAASATSFSSERPEMLRLLPGNKSEVNPIIKCYNWFKIEYSPEKRKKTIWIEQKHIGMIYWIYILLLRCFLFQRIGCASRFPKLFLSVSWPNFSSPSHEKVHVLLVKITSGWWF